MNWPNLIVQLGISALVLFVVFRIGVMLVANMAKADSERTLAMAKAESERTQAIREGFTQLATAHANAHIALNAMQQQFVSAIGAMQQQLVATINGMQNQNYRMEAKLDSVLDLTPVRAMMRAELPLDDRRKPASVVVDHEALNSDDEKTPVDPPPRSPTPTQKSKASTGRAPTSGGFYGPKKPG